MSTLTPTRDAAVRPLTPADPLDALTDLLHRAYRRQVEMGLEPLAGRQDVETTRARCESGECFVAVRDASIVGTVLLNERERVAFPPLFLEPGVSHFSLFAVDPDIQSAGIGHALLDTIIDRAGEIGHDRLAMSVAEPDRALVRYYRRRGFAVVDRWSWPYTNYDSAIMCRDL